MAASWRALGASSSTTSSCMCTPHLMRPLVSWSQLRHFRWVKLCLALPPLPLSPHLHICACNGPVPVLTPPDMRHHLERSVHPWSLLISASNDMALLIRAPSSFCPSYCRPSELLCTTWLEIPCRKQMRNRSQQTHPVVSSHCCCLSLSPNA